MSESHRRCYRRAAAPRSGRYACFGFSATLVRPSSQHHRKPCRLSTALGSLEPLLLPPNPTTAHQPARLAWLLITRLIPWIPNPPGPLCCSSIRWFRQSLRFFSLHPSGAHHDGSFSHQALPGEPSSQWSILHSLPQPMDIQLTRCGSYQGRCRGSFCDSWHRRNHRGKADEWIRLH